MLELVGEKVILQEFSECHLYSSDYMSWLRDLRVVETINRIEYVMPIRFEAVEEYVHSIWDSSSDAFFAIVTKDTNTFIGTQRIAQIDWRTGVADIGIMIGDRNYWGMGMAKDSVGRACKYCFNDLSLRRLTAGTPATNVAMRRCFARVGFKEEGLLKKHMMLKGSLVDRVLFGLFPDELVYVAQED